eukprot:scaffold652093_cov39-Prasinocladus_malaysianus.AAC.1
MNQGDKGEPHRSTNRKSISYLIDHRQQQNDDKTGKTVVADTSHESKPPQTRLQEPIRPVSPRAHHHRSSRGTRRAKLAKVKSVSGVERSKSRGRQRSQEGGAQNNAAPGNNVERQSLNNKDRDDIQLERHR